MPTAAAPPVLKDLGDTGRVSPSDAHRKFAQSTAPRFAQARGGLQEIGVLRGAEYLVEGEQGNDRPTLELHFL